MLLLKSRTGHKTEHLIFYTVNATGVNVDEPTNPHGGLAVEISVRFLELDQGLQRLRSDPGNLPLDRQNNQPAGSVHWSDQNEEIPLSCDVRRILEDSFRAAFKFGRRVRKPPIALLPPI